MLAAALRGHGGDSAFHDLQQGLLHALARHVAGDRGIVGLAGNLVDFVDIDDAALRPFDVVVGRLKQFQDDVLDILAHITGFSQGGGVGHGEGHVDDARQRLGQKRLARAGRPDQHDVGLGQFHVVVLRRVVQTLVVIVHRDRQHLLGVGLADDIVIQHVADFLRRRHAIGRLLEADLVLFADDVHAQFDALVANEHGRARDQFADLVLALSAERAVQGAFGVRAGCFGHRPLSHSRGADRNGP